MKNTTKLDINNNKFLLEIKLHKIKYIQTCEIKILLMCDISRNKIFNQTVVSLNFY